MLRKFLLRIVGVVIGLGICVSVFSSPALAATNLLTNPGAESDGTGWTTISNGGDGMSYDFDGTVRSGAQSFQTSYGLDSISQIVDLFAHGYSANSMRFSPAISFSVWLRTRPDQGGRYYVKFALLQQDGTTVVTSTNVGDSGALISIDAGTDWTQISYTFQNYGSRVRYASIEFGGQDQSGWAGHYGTHFDDASITAAAPVMGDGGGTTMPAWGFVPPAGPFSVAVQGNESARVQTGDVVLAVSASPDVDRMAFSRYEDFHESGIVPFSSVLPWSVCGTPVCSPGIYPVYAKFYQAYGLASPIQRLTITYAPEQATSSDLLILSGASATPGSSVPPRPKNVSLVTTFARDLRQGSRGMDVKQLQQFLNTHGYVVSKNGAGSPGNESDVFGPALRRAVIRFQEAHAEKILFPLDLRKGTGVFGSLTRTLVNAEEMGTP